MPNEKLKLSEELENYMASFLLCVMVIAAALGVIYRYVLQNALSWSEELSRFSFVWFCYFAAAYAVTKKSNIVVDLLDMVFAKRAPKLPRYLRSIAFLFWLGFSISMMVISSQFVLKAYGTGEVTAGLGIPIVYVYWSVPVGFALMTFRLVQQRVRDWREQIWMRGMAESDGDTKPVVD